MKRLTLTYGVAPGPQRTISIPIRRINVVLGLFAIMTVWTTASLGYVVCRGVLNRALSVQPADVAGAASGAVVAAAASEEGSRETAPVVLAKAPAASAAATLGSAPATPGSAVTAAGAALAALSAAPASPGVATDDAAEGDQTAEDVEDAADDTADDAAPLTPLPAALSGVHFAHAGRQLQARFILENRGPATLSGQIHGEATFRRTDGGDEVVEAQATYKARLRTVKALTFVAPEGGGAFTGVKLVVDDTARRRQLVAAYDSIAE